MVPSLWLFSIEVLLDWGNGYAIFESFTKKEGEGLSSHDRIRYNFPVLKLDYVYVEEYI